MAQNNVPGQNKSVNQAVSVGNQGSNGPRSAGGETSAEPIEPLSR
jgi:hypothetical protein